MNTDKTRKPVSSSERIYVNDDVSQTVICNGLLTRIYNDGTRVIDHPVATISIYPFHS